MEEDDRLVGLRKGGNHEKESGRRHERRRGQLRRRGFTAGGGL